MSSEIVTGQIGEPLLRAELEFVLRYLAESQHENCDVLFGYAWGNDYYPTSRWDYVAMPVANVMEEVVRVESLGMGRLGENDLFIRLPRLPIEFRFCHESDLHLEFEETNEILRAMSIRWEALGYMPKPSENPGHAA